MFAFFELLGDFMLRLLDKLKIVIWEESIYSVSLYHVLLAFLVLSIVVTVFWRGGRG